MNENVLKILTQNGLEKYRSLFEQNKLDSIEALAGMTEADFEKLGIGTEEDRKKITAVFQAAKKQETPAQQEYRSAYQEKRSKMKIKKMSKGKRIFFTVLIIIITIIIIIMGA